MRKKLYKAKKTWIIGMAASAVILMGGLSSAKADANTPQSTNVAQTTTNTVSPSNKNDGTLTTNTGNSYENQENITNSSQQVTTTENKVATTTPDDARYPYKATLVSQESTDIENFNDVSPKNIAVPKENHYEKGDAWKDDDIDPNGDPDVPLVMTHYNKHISSHQMLFSKAVNRRGQNYTVGLAAEPGNSTFITYVSDGNGEAIANGSGVDDAVFEGDGEYFGSSYYGQANIEWNNDTAVAFGKNGYSNADTLWDLPEMYQHDGDILKTQVKVHILNNGVLNYEVSWNRDTKEQLAYLRDGLYPNEQPFAFNIGNLTAKKNDDDDDSDNSSIVKINDNLFCNYITLHSNSKKPDYIIQFIKIDLPSAQVISADENPNISTIYNSGYSNSKQIPGVASFIHQNSQLYNEGISIYSPISDKNFIGKHDKLAMIAFDKNQTQRAIKFQSVFLNAQELRDLNSKQILPYVYGLFVGKSGKQLMDSLPAGEPINIHNLTNAWDKDNQGHKFYFGPDGHAVKGWQKFNGNWYYFNPTNGWVNTGWLSNNGHWYYLDSNTGIAAAGWRKINNRWYYFDEQNANAKTGLQTINGKVYYFDPVNAWANTGWQKLNNKWYYFDPVNAWAQTGWFKTPYNWYYFDTNTGIALTSWQKLNNKWYYFDEQNAFTKTGWQIINGKSYHFDSTNDWLIN